MFDNLVVIEPEDVEAYLRTAKVVIGLCDHKVAILSPTLRADNHYVAWLDTNMELCDHIVILNH